MRPLPPGELLPGNSRSAQGTTYVIKSVSIEVHGSDDGRGQEQRAQSEDRREKGGNSNTEKSYLVFFGVVICTNVQRKLPVVCGIWSGCCLLSTQVLLSTAVYEVRTVYCCCPSGPAVCFLQKKQYRYQKGSVYIPGTAVSCK